MTNRATAMLRRQRLAFGENWMWFLAGLGVDQITSSLNALRDMLHLETPLRQRFFGSGRLAWKDIKRGHCKASHPLRLVPAVFAGIWLRKLSTVPDMRRRQPGGTWCSCGQLNGWGMSL